MGGGRKKITLNLKEKPKLKWTVNGSVSARNLRKSDLAGVIFGCTNSTIDECYSKQLFGLPTGHFSYVKNIEPGMPLFLFNYQSRKINGIFEATSFGQLFIDQFGWTDGPDKSPYGAQVRVKTRTDCQPLWEDQFMPVIADNYYAPKLFWNELDKNQTTELLSLFLSSFSRPPSLCSKRAKHEERTRETPAAPPLLLGNGVSNGKQPKCIPKKHENGIKTGEPPVKPWSSLFKPPQNQDPAPDRPVSESTVHHMDHDKLLSHASASLSNMEIGPSCSSSLIGETSHHLSKKSCEEEGPRTYDGGSPLPSAIQKPNKLPRGSASEVHKTCCSKHSGIIRDSKDESAVIRLADKKADTSDSGSAYVVNYSSDLQSTIDKLVKMNQQLLTSKSLKSKHIYFLEDELQKSRNEVQHLKYHCDLTETVSSSVPTNAINSNYLGHGSGIQDSIFIIGGFDGTSWLSSLDRYSPAQDAMKHLTPMKFPRSYACAAKFIDTIYVLGGGDKSLLFDTVESYDQRTDKWICQPPLNKRKGSLAGARLNNKIFAIGGGNGNECFSEVESFDPNVGIWMYAQKMLEKRFAPAVATINGAMYVVGGYDGTYYLNSAERLDVREPSWTKVASMNTHRGCHSLTVLGGKLYAVGGYDGAGVVQTMEVFEPRMEVWMGGKSMKEKRAYAGAAAIGNAIFVMGGMKDDETILDTVEVYEDCKGWRSHTQMKSIGKRSFFTAVA